MTETVSIGPNGESFEIPGEEESRQEFQRLRTLAGKRRAAGDEVVVVVGLGFVGAVMAAVVADAPGKLVIGLQRPSQRSYWKIPMLNRGLPPLSSEDPEVDRLIESGVNTKKSLVATHNYEALKLADVVVVDVQCDFIKNELDNCRSGHADLEALEQSIADIAERIPPEAMVLIETTVPPGTTEQIAYPIMKKIFEKRGIGREPVLAHSYERVMPGKNYVASIRNFWRVCSGVTDEARERVVGFLESVLDTENYPLTVMDRPIESETAKIVENSYRAAILAFMDEWSRFSELNGVDLKKVIEAIKVRPTHSNIMFPGPGIGGYCLPKDGGLGVWAYRHIHGWNDDIFTITPTAIDINDTRSLHVAELVRDGMRNMGRPIACAEVLLLGASYRQDVGDTRYSGSELIVRKLTEMGARVRYHDPYVPVWPEFQQQAADGEHDGDFAPHSKARYFNRQNGLESMSSEGELRQALKGCDAVLLTVPHEQYRQLDMEWLYQSVGEPFLLVDCFCFLEDSQIRWLFDHGCEVKGMGRGHVSRIKRQARLSGAKI